MLKYLGLTVFWTLSVLSGLFVSTVAITETDPLDELRFSLGQSAKSERYRLISPESMEAILAKRLDLFPRSQLPRLVQHIRTLCMEYHFDPAFVLGLIEVESQFHVKAMSPRGAVGLMQVMVETANFVLDRLELPITGLEGYSFQDLHHRPITASMLTDLFLNISVGMKYLAWLQTEYKAKGSAYYMLAAYNVGPARMNQLLIKKDFKPVETKKYFSTIHRATQEFYYLAKREEVNPR